ncbi:MAG TPA: hypothetical protein RMH99_30555 [Sandaracinaceae bacterium LLY-WYZ-13_1]|nr:hypothetical protein [Sandaracinaceae bacterium LLY-WYZ-13_1]
MTLDPRLVLTAALLAGSALVSRATAQTLPEPPVDPSPAEIARGRDAFVEGMAHARAERWARARTCFTRSYRLSGSPVALFNLASTLRSMGRYVAARDAFDRLLSNASIDVQTQRAAERMRAEVAARVARLQVRGVPPGPARVEVDGATRPAVRERPVALWLDPGAHAVAIALGARAWRWRGTLGEGGSRTIDAVFDAPEAADEPGEGPDDPTPWIVLGGAAGAVLALVIGAVVADAEAQLDPRSPHVLELP